MSLLLLLRSAGATVAGAGTGAVGLVVTGASRKVAVVSGSCQVGLAGTANPKKAAPARGVSAAGLAATAGAKKAAVSRGAAPLGLAATRTGVAARVVTGTALFGLSSTGAGRKVRAHTGATALGVTATGTAKRVAKGAGTSAAGMAGSGAARKVAKESGLSPLGFAAVRVGVAARTQSGSCTLGVAATGATTIGGAGPTSPIYETFDGYSTASAWAQGSTHNGWYVNFDGGGTIIPVDVSGRRVLQLESASGISNVGNTATAASLVTSTVSSSGNLTLRARIRTVEQLRSGYSPPGTPNSWETCWLGWNYTEPGGGQRRFYYIALKTGGFELGKVDQSIALPGGQRFLWTDSTPFALGSWCDVLVQQTGAQIQVWVDGTLRADFTDGPGSGGTPAWGTTGEVVMTAGAAALYQEDARAQFDYVALSAATGVRGAAALGVAGTGAPRKVASVTGVGSLGVAATSTPRKTAKEVGTAAVGLAGAVLDKKGTAQRGTAPLGLAATRTGAASRALSGTCSVGLAAFSAPGKTVASPGGRSVCGLAGTSTPKRAARTAGTGPLGVAGLATAAKTAKTAGAGSFGLLGTHYRSDWGPPAGLMAIPFSTTRIDLFWQAVSGASGYDIERDGLLIATDIVGTSYSDTGLVPSSTHSYRARSVRA